MSLRVDFFYDIQSYSTEKAKLEELVLFNLLAPFFFIKDNISIQFLIPQLFLFHLFQISEFDLVQ